ncbi:hypothetical protein IAT38_002540 [Cryptococcus sp. DSM 104549]
MPPLRRLLTETPTRIRLTILTTFVLLSLLLSHQLNHLREYASHHLPLSASEGGSTSNVIEYPITEAVEQAAGQRAKRVAIVGAGASGSAAAFFVRRAGRVVEKRLGLDEGSLLGDVVVFEREGYVGGRSTTVYPHRDQRTRPVELGASIFVEANQHLIKAVEKFNLTLLDPDFGTSGLGIWDGSQFLFTTSSSSWSTTARAIARYGPLSPLRTNRAVSALVKKFTKLYDAKWLRERGVVESVEDFAEKVGLGREVTTRTGEDWARNVVGAGERWVGEIMDGSTRVNYGSNINQIHGLGAGVSMATGGASQVEGGNWRIFQAMLDDSKAQLHLHTEVQDILPLKSDDGKPLFRIKTNNTEVSDEEPFDVVFFAAPWHSSTISKGLQRHFVEPIPPQPYVRLHVTYLATSALHPLPAFFNLPPDARVPNTILTSSSTSRSPTPPGTPPTPPPRFQSITWHGETFPGSREYAVKIFSRTRLSDRFLREMLGEDPRWLLRKEWDSYPELRPTAGYAPVELLEGVQYLAGMETWVSTMETQTISGREAVARVVEGWWGLGLGECEDGNEAWDWTC